MSTHLSTYKKATSLIEVDNAVRLDVPITPDHPFYTDFSDVRGDFEDRMIYRTLNVNPKTFVFNREANLGNKVLLFLAGMRGAGKTSELSKIAQKLNNKDCFFCVVCNLDEGLDKNDMEYMDILIFQIERLVQELQEKQIHVEERFLASLFMWFSERVKEINKSIKKEGGFELEVEAKTPSFFSFLSITGKLKSNITGNKENAEKIRTTFRSSFTDFSLKVNEFVEGINMTLRKNGIAQEVLFVVDGLEKTATSDIRKKIVLDESDRMRQIKVNTVFTLPIELKPETQRLAQLCTVIPFPFVKIRERDGSYIDKAIRRFEDFVYKRIDATLFDSPDTVRKAILHGGGSPRELLRILEYANLFADEDRNKITLEDLDKGIKKLAAQTAQYVSSKDLEKLKVLKNANEAGVPLTFDSEWQDLIEKLLVLEYNDGTYKRVNPILEASALYQHYVG
ncbi:MAG TPA: hypothetical protein PKD78_01140 [Saprospiraceae bacterium]|nr:hypothetical protein [Saprospiraceae bacterium]